MYIHQRYFVRNILIERNNWERYKLFYRELRDYQIKEVDAMIHCQDSSKGFIVVHCDKCNEDSTIHFLSVLTQFNLYLKTLSHTFSIMKKFI